VLEVFPGGNVGIMCTRRAAGYVAAPAVNKGAPDSSIRGAYILSRLAQLIAVNRA